MPDFNHGYIGNLVIKAQAGNNDAFAELYATTYNHIYNYSMHYLRDQFLAQDAVQDTYIMALRKINTIKDPTLFVAWLNQICFHICYDMGKKLKNNTDSMNTEILELVSDDVREHNPEGSYEDKEELNILQNAVDSLPFLEHQVIVMKYYNDMTLEDIADALSCSRSTVKRYLKSSKEALKKMLGKET